MMQDILVIGLAVAVLVLALLLIAEKRKGKAVQIGLPESDTDAKLDMITREIHHRVKNNFQTVSSLLNLQTRYLKDEFAKGVLWESQNRIQSMALIHQQLYQREVTGAINMPVYLNELVEELTYSYNAPEKGVSIKAEVADLELDAEMAVPLGLIIHELILNSFKYAFPEEREGRIAIRLWKSEEALHLVVEDDGVGLPEGMKPLEVKTSYGMRLVILFTQELKGEVTYEQGDVHGTRAVLNCPLT